MQAPSLSDAEYDRFIDYMESSSKLVLDVMRKEKHANSQKVAAPAAQVKAKPKAKVTRKKTTSRTRKRTPAGQSDTL